ncbi:uncharacterized protein [Coffea arabica]|uniref:RING-type domain-containing protein n=1 Tax=Coffea arabica TaxID=13443 RepID=A0A6P6WHA5_COFAR|nr:uncharacterized protein LOC113732803 [Coffea arabica]
MEHHQSKGDTLSPHPNPNRNPCPICLGPVNDESYLDQCFHKFCYNCILRWTKVAAYKHSAPPTSVKCPLCKTENFSIIHGCDGFSFRRHFIGQDFHKSDFFTKAHKYRLQSYYCETGTLIDVFNPTRYWKLHKYLQPSHWLYDWMRREIQALTQEEDVDIIVHHILGVIESWRRNEQTSSRTSPEAKQERFRILVSEAARCFLTGRTNQFVNELEMFLASGLNMDAYDKVYLKNLGWKIPEINEDEEEPHEHAPVVPNLYLFDEHSDYTE